MEPEIVEKGQMLLLGFSFFGDPFAESGGWTEENEIGRLWQRLIAYLETHGAQIRHLSEPEVMYEVHVADEEAAARGHFQVFAGLEVDALEDVPPELLVKVLPATTYAVFTLRGAEIVSDWSKMIDEGWLAGSPYEPAYAYGFQRYDHRFKGVDQIEDSVLEAWVPVRRRGAQARPTDGT
jgi:predicted transcriptional regulator YdeE